MHLPWTEELALASAPDDRARAAARRLARPGRWVALARDGRAAWGAIHGSGRDPYTAAVDRAGPGFRCSCPSRKQPCKHGLALGLLLAGQPGALTEAGERPAWVAEWLESRDNRSTRKLQAPERPVDVEARRQRIARRESRVSDGLLELDRWLEDLARQGLAAAREQPLTFWYQMAARLVDAQAPGLARHVRGLAAAAASGEGWQERLLGGLARLVLVVEAYRRGDRLPAGLRADARAEVGWPVGAARLAELEATRGEWRVVGQRSYETDELLVLRTWLSAVGSGQSALILEFAAGGRPLDSSLSAGTVVEADLVFHPGAAPVRASIRESHGVVAALDALPEPRPHIDSALARWAEVLAVCPWRRDHLMTLGRVVPVPPQRRGGRWGVKGELGAWLPLPPRFAHGWELMAVSGGRPLTVCGEWDGDALRPLSVSSEGRCYVIGARGAFTRVGVAA